jgi:hypothetical protein
MMTASMTKTSTMLVRVIFSTSDADYTLESNCGCRDTAGLLQRPTSLSLDTNSISGWITIPCGNRPNPKTQSSGHEMAGVPSLQLVSALCVIAYLTGHWCNGDVSTGNAWPAPSRITFHTRAIRKSFSKVWPRLHQLLWRLCTVPASRAIATKLCLTSQP